MRESSHLTNAALPSGTYYLVLEETSEKSPHRVLLFLFLLLFSFFLGYEVWDIPSWFLFLLYIASSCC